MQRTTAITAKAERKILDAIIKNYPCWVTPDLLTATALASAILTAASYTLSSYEPKLLFLATAAILIHWIADSTDGGLARYRKQQRPNYGHYVDHMLDMISMLLIGAGLALGRVVEWRLAFALIALFYLWAIHSAFLDKIKGTYKISYFGLGPTEGRIGLITANTIKYYFPETHILGHHIINVAIAALLIAGALALTVKIIKTIIALKREDEEKLLTKKAAKPSRASNPRHQTKSAQKE